MTIEPIGNDSIALLLEKDELSDICYGDGELDIKAAQKLVVSAFAKCGLCSGGLLELETYCGAGGALMFARILDREREYYFFSSFEDVIALNRALKKPKPKMPLTYYKGDYIMTSAHGVERIIGEFAQKRSCPASFAGLMSEHGQVISDDIFADIGLFFKDGTVHAKTLDKRD